MSGGVKVRSSWNVVAVRVDVIVLGVAGAIKAVAEVANISVAAATLNFMLYCRVRDMMRSCFVSILMKL